MHSLFTVSLDAKLERMPFEAIFCPICLHTRSNHEKYQKRALHYSLFPILARFTCYVPEQFDSAKILFGKYATVT